MKSKKLKRCQKKQRKSRFSFEVKVPENLISLEKNITKKIDE